MKCSAIALWMLVLLLAVGGRPSDASGEPAQTPGAPYQDHDSGTPAVGLVGCAVDIPGDLDCDTDVDLDDHDAFAACAAGPAVPAETTPICLAVDFDDDTDVDSDDFAVFQRCYSGPGQPASPYCATFSVTISGSTLHLVDAAPDTIIVLRLQAGAPSILEIDLGGDGVPDFAFDRDLFNRIVVDAGGGDDLVRIDEINGIFTNTELTAINGEAGDDTLIGGSGPETFVGGPGDDTALMGSGNDRGVWNPGDGTDVLEGGADSDTVEVNGSDSSESFTVTANGTRVRFDRISPAPFFLDIGSSENLILNANAGDDTLACTGNLAALIQITADGGPGNDTLGGSNGVDLLIGGDDNDFIDGNQGNDVAFMGAGDDVFQWDPGDGSDTIEGQADTDVLRFNGSNANEILDLSNNGGRVRFTRNIGSIVTDLNGIEQFDLRALGGADTVTVNDLGGTDAVNVSVGLSGTLGGNTGDAQLDQVIVNATSGPDGLMISGYGSEASVSGLATLVTVTTAEPSTDQLIVNTLAGADTIDATALPADIIGLTADGGVDNDGIQGGLGNDVLLGGDGDDVLDGKGGNDQLSGGNDNDTIIGGDGDDAAQLGAGNDRFIWNPGDDTDFVEGEGDIDTVEVNGGSGAEIFTVTANGTRVRFDRVDPAPFSLDIGTCENLVLKADGGNDTLACTGNLAALIQITADGGPGDDTLGGSNGADLLIGGDDNDFIDGNQGNDVALMGAGNDTFQWDPGDGSDTVEGQAGTDVLMFNGSNGSEIMEVTPNGSRVRFTRNLGNVVMDLNDLARINVQALGSADTMIVNDLTGTGVAQVDINLAGTFGGATGDAQPDNVVVNATSAIDALILSGSGSTATVAGLSTVVNVMTAESANDRLTVNAMGGDDTIEAVGLPSSVIALTLNGGEGNDTLSGGAGPQTLDGGADNDVIDGGAGDDFVQMGLGNDRFIWNAGDGTDIVEGGDGTDTVEINGEDVTESFTTTANGTRVRFDRLSPAPFFLDINACENLVLHANGGDDTFTCTGNLAALIQITAEGGPGDDTLMGSNGADLLIGGDDDDFIDGNQGSDVALLGGGNDTFRWDPGDGNDVIEGQAGIDALAFNGSNGSEIMELTANGSRLRFTRNLGNIVLDVNEVEQVDVTALGAADSILVGNLAGTGVEQVNLELAGTFGGGTSDSQADLITINGTDQPDAISLSASFGSVLVSGLPADVRISHPDATLDRLTVNGLGGSDTFSTGPGVSGLILLTLNP